MPDTKYSTRYSERAFDTIRAGMSQEEVLSLLGPPLNKYYVDAEDRVIGDIASSETANSPGVAGGDDPKRQRFLVWKYSDRTERDSHFYIRKVKFGDDLKVSTVVKDFYVD